MNPTKFSGLGVVAVATASREQLRRSRDYRGNGKADALVAEVQDALVAYHPLADDDTLRAPRAIDENPIRRLGRPCHGSATGFFAGLTGQNAALKEVMQRHTLYYAGLAALALAEPGDDLDAILVLSSYVQSWRAGQSARSLTANAGQTRNPFVELALQQRRYHPDATAKEFWHILCGDHTIDYKGRLVDIAVSEYADSLEWMCGDRSGIRPWQGFDPFLSRLTRRIFR